MLLKHYLILLLVLYFGHINAQDTVSIYYKLGEYKILNNELKKVDLLKKKLSTQLLDSIVIIGSTDKVGSFKSNQKLAIKRAYELFQLIEPDIVTSNTIYRIFTLVSVKTGIDTMNRRVDVIMFGDEESEVISSSSIKGTIKQIENKCYRIDYEMLSKCAIKTTKVKTIEFIEIRTFEPTVLNDSLYFFNHSKDGKKKKLKALDWHIDKTIKGNNNEICYLAKIPKKDFDKFQIFTISNPPCKECSQMVNSNILSYEEITHRKVDSVSSYCLQFRSPLFKRKNFKIRVPKPLINLNEIYYSSYSNKVLKWDSSRLNKNYYYTKIGYHSYGIEMIMREFKFCDSKKVDKTISNWDSLYPPFLKYLNKKTAITLNVDYIWESENISVPTFGISIRKIGTLGWRFTTGIGYINSLNAFAKIRINYDFISFPLNLHYLPGSWSKHKSMSQLFNHNGAFFISTKHLVLSDFDRINYTNNSLNIGFSYTNVNQNILTPSFYVEYGVSYNLMESRLKTLFSVGIEMALQRNI